MESSSYKNEPIGRRRLKINSRKNPATVGGSTIGSVKSPSTNAFARLPMRITLRAVQMPRKKQITVATRPVLSEIQSGL